MYIDTHSRMSSQENWGSLLIDGLHFSDAGQKFLFDQIVDLLGSDERAAIFRNLRPQFPNYSRLNKVESPDVSIEKVHPPCPSPLSIPLDLSCISHPPCICICT
jgi:hypothetical protein